MPQQLISRLQQLIQRLVKQPTAKAKIGKQAEDKALAYLKARGLKLIKRNYAAADGEIDLIMRDSDVLVFVEVRFRQGNQFGTPEESVDSAKSRRLELTALDFQKNNPRFRRINSRFDIVSVSPNDKILWYQDAIEPRMWSAY